MRAMFFENCVVQGYDVSSGKSKHNFGARKLCSNPVFINYVKKLFISLIPGPLFYNVVIKEAPVTL